MMDDLISRKAAIDQAMGKLDYTDLVFDTATESEIVYMLRSLPSVPAVPLDKLSEWLNEHCGRPNYCNDRLCVECNLDGEGFEYETCWETLLTEWMEGLDDAEIMVQKT